MPSVPCTEPLCPNASHHRGYCLEHARTRERHINRAGRRIYGTKRWALTRRRYLFEHPLCETPGCKAIAEDVHHKVDIADGGDPWNPDGLEALCHSCHSRTTRRGQLAG